MERSRKPPGLITHDLRGSPGPKDLRNPSTTMPMETTLTSSRPDMVVVRGRQLRWQSLSVVTPTGAMNDTYTRKSRKPKYHQIIPDAEKATLEGNIHNYRDWSCRSPPPDCTLAQEKYQLSNGGKPSKKQQPASSAAQGPYFLLKPTATRSRTHLS